MKTKIITSVLGLFLALPIVAQDRTTVNAMSSEISDNLDLRAVASVFGDSQNLEDFERRLNDPKLQISNLDLNYDNQVDYLRVVESVEGYTHLIVIQSVLGLDTFQDVATIEVERDQNNQVSIQVVGDVYMYGTNYIYEPVYVQPPVIFTSFWIGGYNPYRSSWYWGYYPTYYHYWRPYPIHRYRRNVHVHINTHNHYNYVNVRRSTRAVALYNGRRANYAERQYPSRSFSSRNTNVNNRRELEQVRKTNKTETRNGQVRNATPRSNNAAGTTAPVRQGTATGTRTTTNPVRANGATGVRTSPNAVKQNATPRTQPNTNTGTRINSTSVRTDTRTNNPVQQNIRNQNNVPRANPQPRASAQQSNSQRQSPPQRQTPRAPAQNQGARNNEQGGGRR
jgi:hypothetical protein